MRLIKKTSRNIVKIVMIFVMTMGLFATEAYAVSLSEGPVTLLVDANAAGDAASRAEGATYKTLSGAVNRASNGDTIKLQTDILSSADLQLVKSIILDLNGKSLTKDSSPPIINLISSGGLIGNLDIIDSSEEKNGVISNMVSGTSTLKNDGPGSIKIYSGKIHSPNGLAISCSKGNIDVLGGIVTSSGNTANSYATSLLGSCNLSVSSGTVSSLNSIAISNSGTGDINVSGGTITSKNHAITATVGSGQAKNVTITGGNISSTDPGTASIFDAYSNVNISAGNFQSNVAVAKLKISGNPNVSIRLSWLADKKFEIVGPLTGLSGSIILNGDYLTSTTEGTVVATATSEEYVNASKFLLTNVVEKTLIKNGLNLVMTEVLPEPSDTEKVNSAKISIDEALTNLVVSNATTATDVLNAVKQAVLHGVNVEWDSTNNFNKVDATSLATGLITGTIKLTLNSVNESVVVSKIIAKLEPEPITDSTKIAEVKTAIELALVNLVVSNTTTATDVLNAVKQAVLHGVSVEWDKINNFNKVDATSLATGLITGNLKLYLNDTNVAITLNKVIKQLPTSETVTKELLQNTPTGVKVEGIDGVVFDSKTELVVTPVMEDLEKEKMDRFALSVNSLENELELVQIYNIKLMLNGVAVQPNGKVKVTLPLSEQQKGYSNLQIVYIDDDGVATKVISTVKDNEITFMTDHFSYYGIVGTSASEVLPETSDSNNSLVWWIMLLGSLLVGVTEKKIRKLS